MNEKIAGEYAAEISTKQCADELEAIKSMQRDAQRYRWLRHGDNDEHVLKFSNEARCGTDHVWLLRGEELDAAIDEARSAGVT